METKIILYLGLANLIIGVFYAIIVYVKKDRTRAFLMLLFILVCPVIGVLFLLVDWIQQRFVFRKEININELSFHTDGKKIIVGPDFEKEINVVSIEEALIISNTNDKRKVILDVLKEDYNKSISMISHALNSEDSETSHYAASIISDVKSNFKITVQMMEEKSKSFPEDTQIQLLLIDYIQKFIETKVLSEIEELTYTQKYEQLMNELYNKNKNEITSLMYKQIIYHLLFIKKSDEAIIWGERAMQAHPNELDTYKGNLKLYFETGEKNKFFQTLTLLKESQIEYDSECNDLIHFYQ